MLLHMSSQIECDLTVPVLQEAEFGSQFAANQQMASNDESQEAFF
jgi:hypothetical protein